MTSEQQPKKALGLSTYVTVPGRNQILFLSYEKSDFSFNISLKVYSLLWQSLRLFDHLPQELQQSKRHAPLIELYMCMHYCVILFSQLCVFLFSWYKGDFQGY